MQHSRGWSAPPKHAMVPAGGGRRPAVFDLAHRPSAVAAPDKPRVHRALRLVMAAGLAGAALCLLLATIAMVVSLGNANVSSAASNRSLTSGRSHRSRFVVGATLATYRGTGGAESRRFQVGEPGDWGLSWRFSCQESKDSFVVREGAGSVTDDIEIDAEGLSGHGLIWDTRDPGKQILVIQSDCSWALRVVLPKQ